MLVDKKRKQQKNFGSKISNCAKNIKTIVFLERNHLTLIRIVSMIEELNETIL